MTSLKRAQSEEVARSVTISSSTVSHFPSDCLDLWPEI